MELTLGILYWKRKKGNKRKINGIFKEIATQYHVYDIYDIKEGVL